MRDLAFFRGDIWDLSLKQWREAGISVACGSGISCFYRVGMRDWQRKKSGIWDFNSSVTKPQAGGNEPFARIAVSGFE